MLTIVAVRGRQSGTGEDVNPVYTGRVREHDRVMSDPRNDEELDQSETAPAAEPNESSTADEPSTEQLQEPSTEKDPGEQPKADEPQEPEPSHRAVGIGVIDTLEPEPGTSEE